MVSVFAYELLNLIDPQMTSYKPYKDTVFDRYGILDDLEAARDVKKLYCRRYIYDSSYA